MSRALNLHFSNPDLKAISHFNSISIRVTPVRDCRYGQIIEKTKVNKKLGALYPSPNAPVLKEGFKIGLVLQLIHITWATTTLIYPTIYSYNKLVHINAPATFHVPTEKNQMAIIFGSD